MNSFGVIGTNVAGTADKDNIIGCSKQIQLTNMRGSLKKSNKSRNMKKSPKSPQEKLFSSSSNNLNFFGFLFPQKKCNFLSFTIKEISL